MEQRPTINGYLWLVSPPEGDEYWLYTSTEDYPFVPEEHMAECHGGGLIYADSVTNAKIEKHDKITVVKTFSPLPHRKIRAIRAVIDDGQA